MKVLCAGTDASMIERVQLAIRFRWPETAFLIAPEPDDALSIVESEDLALVVLLSEESRQAVKRFCTELRQSSDVPLIVIGEGEGEYSLDGVKALEAGADDYILASGQLTELVARIVALLRRVQAPGASATGSLLQSGDLLLNPGTYDVFLRGKRVNLTATEFNLLHLLIRNRGSVVRHQVVERTVWGNHADSATLVKKYVQRLRRKLEEASGEGHEFIRSVYSVGYLFVGQEKEQGSVSA